MSDVVIKAENLGKLYKIGAQQQRYKTLRESLVGAVTRPFNRLRSTFQRSSVQPVNDTIWALKDVSFEVKQGEVVGIIGRNGAGKSTLLKILSHITEPTEGRVELHGRVGSLLEVGTGFHAELTGRENIYLNGAILGMRRAEVERRFDEIVAFAETEKFLDTPVKRYSSGMYVRLAFAVAAHLEPEILLVDEVLAVGDGRFQKKCLGKMGDIAKEGRTVLFVSHNMGAIETLCRRGMLLDDGCLKVAGEVHDVVSTYLGMNHVEAVNPFKGCLRSGTGKVRVTDFHLESPGGNRVGYATSGSPIVFVVGYETNAEKLREVSVGFSVHQKDESNLFVYYSHFSDVLFSDIPQRGEFHCLLRELPVAPGNFLVGLRIMSAGIEADWPKILVPISVHMGDFYRTGSFDGALTSWGPILIRGDWSIRSAPHSAIPDLTPSSGESHEGAGNR
jgi:lipopolysaccharide transport system ATP-binding protein